MASTLAAAKVPVPIRTRRRRIDHGDVQDTSITSGFANSEQYGNVSRLVVAPGKYLFLAGDAMERAARSGGVIAPGDAMERAARSGGVIAPGSMAILEVIP